MAEPNQGRRGWVSLALTITNTLSRRIGNVKEKEGLSYRFHRGWANEGSRAVLKPGWDARFGKGIRAGDGPARRGGLARREVLLRRRASTFGVVGGLAGASGWSLGERGAA